MAAKIAAASQQQSIEVIVERRGIDRSAPRTRRGDNRLLAQPRSTCHEHADTTPPACAPPVRGRSESSADEGHGQIRYPVPDEGYTVPAARRSDGWSRARRRDDPSERRTGRHGGALSVTSARLREQLDQVATAARQRQRGTARAPPQPERRTETERFCRLLQSDVIRKPTRRRHLDPRKLAVHPRKPAWSSRRHPESPRA